MEKDISPENIRLYITWRDDFLKIISGNICRPCTDPRKQKATLDYENPLNCGCRCDRVESMLITASNLDTDIKNLTSKNN